MPEKQNIKFTEDVEVLDHNGDIEFEAKAGDVVSLVSASCDRWVKRGKAVPVKATPKNKATPKKQAVDK